MQTARRVTWHVQRRKRKHGVRRRQRPRRKPSSRRAEKPRPKPRQGNCRRSMRCTSWRRQARRRRQPRQPMQEEGRAGSQARRLRVDPPVQQQQPHRPPLRQPVHQVGIGSRRRLRRIDSNARCRVYSVVNERNRTPDQGRGPFPFRCSSLCLRVRRYSRKLAATGAARSSRSRCDARFQIGTGHGCAVPHPL